MFWRPFSIDWDELLWRMARDPSSVPELSYELDNPGAISCFVAEAPIALRERLLSTALDIVLRGSATEKANVRLTPFEEAPNAIAILSPLIAQRASALDSVGGAFSVLARLARLPDASTLAPLVEQLVHTGARSPELTEAAATICPALLAREASNFVWPEDPADLYVVLAALPEAHRATVIAALPNRTLVADFAKRVGDPQKLLPQLTA